MMTQNPIILVHQKRLFISIDRNMDSGLEGKNNTGKSAVFLKRLFSTVFLWTIVLAALFAPWKVVYLSAFLVIIILFTTIGMLEFYGFVERKNLYVYKELGIAFGVVYTVAVFVIHAFLDTSNILKMNFSLLIFSLLMILLLARRLISPVNSDGFVALGSTLLGLLYVPFLFGFVQFIYFSHGPYLLLFFMLLTKFSDSGAYIFGSLFGKHKMSPSISPGKTWEGFAGAILMPIAVGFLSKFLFGEKLALISSYEVIILGVVLGLGAVIGDLVESAFKRECGKKDSGNYFPGVGGILDVLDSILFNAPIMYFYLYLKAAF